jgi:hypothetical protein
MKRIQLMFQGSKYIMQLRVGNVHNFCSFFPVTTNLSASYKYNKETRKYESGKKVVYEFSLYFFQMMADSLYLPDSLRFFSFFESTTTTITCQNMYLDKKMPGAQMCTRFYF